MAWADKSVFLHVLHFLQWEPDRFEIIGNDQFVFFYVDLFQTHAAPPQKGASENCGHQEGWPLRNVL